MSKHSLLMGLKSFLLNHNNTIKSCDAFAPQHWKGVALWWFFWGLGLSVICLLVAFSQHWHRSTSSTTMSGKWSRLHLARHYVSVFFDRTMGQLPFFHNACYQDMGTVLRGLFWLLKENSVLEIYVFQSCATANGHSTTTNLFSQNMSLSPHLNLLVAGGELPLLEDHDMVADPLEKKSHQLVVFLPAQLQFLQPTQRKKIVGGWTTTDRRALLLLLLRVQ